VSPSYITEVDRGISNSLSLSANSIPLSNVGAVIVKINNLSASKRSKSFGGKYEPNRFAKKIAKAIYILFSESELAIKSATKINRTAAMLLHTDERKYFSLMRKTFLIVDKEQSKNLRKNVVKITTITSLKKIKNKKTKLVMTYM